MHYALSWAKLYLRCIFKKLVKFFDKHLVGRGTIGLENFVPTLYWCGAIILLSI